MKDCWIAYIMLIHLAAEDCGESDIAPKMLLPPVYLMESMVIATFYQSLLTFIKNIAQPNSAGIDSKDVKALLDVRLNDHTNDVPVVALGDIEQCIMNLKRNKAAGYDGVVNEHLIFGDHHLRVHFVLTVYSNAASQLCPR